MLRHYCSKTTNSRPWNRNFSSCSRVHGYHVYDLLQAGQNFLNPESWDHNIDQNIFCAMALKRECFLNWWKKEGRQSNYCTDKIDAVGGATAQITTILTTTWLCFLSSKYLLNILSKCISCFTAFGYFNLDFFSVHFTSRLVSSSTIHPRFTIQSIYKFITYTSTGTT